MTDAEIKARAREARIVACGVTSERRKAGFRSGSLDASSTGIKVAIRALRDLSVPLGRLVPASADLIEARRLAVLFGVDASAARKIASGEWDNHYAVQRSLLAINRGRELERDTIATEAGTAETGTGSVYEGAGPSGHRPDGGTHV